MALFIELDFWNSIALQQQQKHRHGIITLDKKHHGVKIIEQLILASWCYIIDSEKKN